MKLTLSGTYEMHGKRQLPAPGSFYSRPAGELGAAKKGLSEHLGSLMKAGGQTPRADKGQAGNSEKEAGRV